MKPPQRADTELHHQGSPQGQEPLPHEQARQVCWSRGHGSSDGSNGIIAQASYYSWVGCSSTSTLKRQGALGQQGPQSKVQKDGEQASREGGRRGQQGDYRRKASRHQPSASQNSDRTGLAAFKYIHPPREMTFFTVLFHRATRSNSESLHALRILANGFSFTQSPRSIFSSVLINTVHAQCWHTDKERFQMELLANV